MRGSKDFSNLRGAWRDFIQSSSRGAAAALADEPLPAADRDSTKPPPLALADPQKWQEPLSKEQEIQQLLNCITFGLRADDIERARRIGVGAFLDEQLHPEKMGDAAVEAKVAALPTLRMSAEELMEKFPPPKLARQLGERRDARRSLERGSRNASNQSSGSMEMNRPEDRRAMREERQRQAIEGPRRVIMELAQQELLRAVYSSRQLEEMMVQFWMNHFNIFAPKGADKWLITSFERDTIRPRALGKFEPLLVATSQSPAMLFYLDNWMSSTPNPTYGGGDPRRFDRGSNHPSSGLGLGRGGIFGRGAFGQGNLGNRRLAQARRPDNANLQNRRRGINENYARELMELHTLGVEGGYTQKDVVEVARCFTGWTIERPRQGAEFLFNPRMHDFGSKIVLDRKIPGKRGMEDGIEVLRLLAHHPSTARHISLKLCRRFISDNPPPSLIDRSSETFLSTGGDIRAALKTILTSPEFYSQAAWRAKVKSPLELVASSFRALGAETDAGFPVLAAVARMGEPMFQYQAPTGFPDRADTWINSSSLLMRVKFAGWLAANRIPGTEIPYDRLSSTLENTSQEQRVDALAAMLLGGTLTPATRQTILKQLDSEGQLELTAESPSREIASVTGLLLASPEFQRR